MTTPDHQALLDEARRRHDRQAYDAVLHHLITTHGPRVTPEPTPDERCRHAAVVALALWRHRALGAWD